MREYIKNKIDGAETLEELFSTLQMALELDLEVDPSGQIIEKRALVERAGKMKIEIYPNEHPPPHFHVKLSDYEASFTIQRCELLNGKLPPKETRLVKAWYVESREKLINFWNTTRPGGCTVGLYED